LDAVNDYYDTEKQKQKLKEEVEYYKSQFKLEHQEKIKLLESSSWKITQPLRAAKHRLKRQTKTDKEKIKTRK